MMPPAHFGWDTTYICVVDGDGMMVSLIESVSANFGCGVVAGETGIVLNNRVGRGFTLEDGHPNLYAPGKRTMTPSIASVADQADPVLVGGTPGGDGQPQWNLQTLVGLIDGGWMCRRRSNCPAGQSGRHRSDHPAHAYELRVEIDSARQPWRNSQTWDTGSSLPRRGMGVAHHR